MSTPTPRVGIIGCGDISPLHLKTFASLGLPLAAVCDTDRARAERRAREHGTADTAVLTDHRALLAREDIELVTVATPVSAHTALTLDALRAGKHVACEKPAALNVAEVESVAAAARAADRRVIYFSSRMRFGPALVALPYVRRGALGRIYRVEVQFARRRGRPGVDIIRDAPWFIDARRAGGGVIMDMGQYFMDLALHLTGWPAFTTVSATGFRGFAHDLPEGATFDVEEQCTLLARTAQGISFSFDLAWINHGSNRSFVRVLGTEGGFELNLAAKEPEQAFTFFQDGDGPWQWMNTCTEWKDKQNSNDRVYGQLIEAIRGKDPGVGTTPEQAAVITKLTSAALKSMQEGREMPV